MSHPMDDLGAIMEDGADLKESVLLPHNSIYEVPAAQNKEKLIKNLDNLIQTLVNMKV